MNTLRFLARATLGAVPGLALLLLAGCSEQRGPGAPREAKITGRSTDASVELRARWNPTNRYVFQLDAVHFDSVPSRRTEGFVERETTIGQGLALTVARTGSDDEARRLDLELQSLQVQFMADDNATVLFDSDNKVMLVNGDRFTDSLLNTIKGRLHLGLSPEGRVARVGGTGDLLKSMAIDTHPSARQSLARRVFSDALYKQAFDTSVLPTNAVRVGDTWKTPRDLPGGPSVEVTCTFRGWQQRELKNCALIEFRGEVEEKVPNQPVPPATLQEGVQRLVAGKSPLSGNIAGRLWFDPEVGLPDQLILDAMIKSKNTTRRSSDTNAPLQTFTSKNRWHLELKLLDVSAARP